MGYQDAWQRQLIESLHGPLEAAVEPAEPEGPPNFDGGVREPAPTRGNPETDHNALIVQLFQDHRGAGAADFWPMAGPAKSPPAEEGTEGEDWRKGGT